MRKRQEELGPEAVRFGYGGNFVLQVEPALIYLGLIDF